MSIAYKLLVGGEENHTEGGTTVWEAVKTSIIADAVMSLDNVLALAGVAHEFMPIMVGIFISIPIIIWGSQIIIKVMERFPIIVYGGAGLLAYTAGEMIVNDEKIRQLLHNTPLHTTIPIATTVLILAVGYIQKKKQERKEQSQAA